MSTFEVFLSLGIKVEKGREKPIIRDNTQAGDLQEKEGASPRTKEKVRSSRKGEILTFLVPVCEVSRVPRSTERVFEFLLFS